MEKVELIGGLIENHRKFIGLINSLSDEDFSARPNPEKWSNGENLAHILQSTQPLNQALALPKFQLKMMFGKSNRPSRSYEELVKKYQEKLAEGGKASGKYLPKEISIDERAKLADKLSVTVKNIVTKISDFSENDFDEFILPHPLLGKLTLREMMYFTSYHVQHHQETVERNLAIEN